MAGEIICDFFSDLALIDRATHYRSQENGKDKPGPVSRIIHREPCPFCGRTGLIKTDSGVNATFARLHPVCMETRAAELERFGKTARGAAEDADLAALIWPLVRRYNPN